MTTLLIPLTRAFAPSAAHDAASTVARTAATGDGHADAEGHGDDAVAAHLAAADAATESVMHLAAAAAVSLERAVGSLTHHAAAVPEALDDGVAVPLPHRSHPGQDQPEVGRSALGAWGVAIRCAPDPALMLDPTGGVVAVSASAAALLDRRVGELLGRPLAEAVAFVDFHHSPRPVGPQAWPTLVPLSTLRSGAPGRGLLRVRRADGRLQAADAVAAPLHDARGRLAGALVMLTPIKG